jgi:hypothetical protein
VGNVSDDIQRALAAVKAKQALLQQARQKEVNHRPAKLAPTGLTEAAVNALIQKALEDYKKTTPASPGELPDLKLRDLVVAAKTILGHFVALARFTDPRMNRRQGDDMRAWIAAAEKVLEGT